jgi:hypothetical protein
MSAGDKHHSERLGERELDHADNDPKFQALLARGFAVSFDYDIPYLGGYSQNGATIYIDKDTPEQLKLGRRVYQLKGPQGLVRGIITHEHWEKTAMLAWGWGYDPAHELATHAENRFARDALGIPPAEYEEAWAPVIRMAEKKLNAQPPDQVRGAQLPPDLDRTPYESK